MTFNPEPIRHVWTHGAITCYMRLCNCEGCPISDLLKSSRCMMKYSVAALVTQVGQPTEHDCGRVGISYEAFKKAREQSQILLE